MVTKTMNIVSLLAAFALILSTTVGQPSKVAFAADLLENTEALCTDGIDNDNDGTKDATDTECNPFNIVVVVPVVAVENTEALCTDGLDNDNDGTKDATDTDCNAFAAPVVLPLVITITAENSFALCNDDLDNDNDGTKDYTDSDCNPFAARVSVENTLILCTDDLDNDNDGTKDATDSDCNPFATPVSVENTLILCTDGQDNDNDGTKDATDTDCNQFATSTPVTPVVPPVTPAPGPTVAPQTGGGGFSGGFSSFSLPSTGTVLGASTGPATSSVACELKLTTYMKQGRKNSVSEVRKLQTALNALIGSGLPVTGFFGPKTDAAVRSLQQKNSDKILMPWVNLKLMQGPTPTGYVYKTTQWYINSTLCSSENIPAPMLP